ncbi:MAG: electron transport complex subunit RsxE [Armatimonadota bacterium]|nr:MAG: electron transport complex subunit RsxE [Armatimonadota bacterium]
MAQDGPTALERFINGILPENPVYRQLLGMCPTLAVTNGMKPAMTMAGATAFVLICANVLISLIRGQLKPHLRILVFTLTIATFVTIADRFLAAYMYEMSKQLGPYVPLIIVNCVIISRCEICASKQKVGVALADGVGMSLGFAIALASIATVREILGSGTWFGLPALPAGWPGWGIMVLPPGAFLTLGLLLGVAEWASHRQAQTAIWKTVRMLWSWRR